MNLADIRRDLAEAIDAYGWQSYDHISPNPEVPALCVGFPEVEYAASLRKAKITVNIVCLVGQVEAEDSQRQLDALLSSESTSLVSILNQATGSWDGLKVVSAGDYRAVNVGSSTLLALDVIVELIA